MGTIFWTITILGLGIVFIVYHAYKMGKEVAFDLADEELKRISKKSEMRGALNVFTKKLDVLNASQKKMIGGLDNPSKGASHSRWKNDVVDRVKTIEEEKMTIYKEILGYGLDPSVAIHKDGKEEVVKLSEAVKRYEAANSTAPLKPTRHLKSVKNTDPS